MTQAVFALFMGVSVKTVEAWESGRTHPTGPACRLITFFLKEKSDPVLSGPCPEEDLISGLMNVPQVIDRSDEQWKLDDFT